MECRDCESILFNSNEMALVLCPICEGIENDAVAEVLVLCIEKYDNDGWKLK